MPYELKKLFNTSKSIIFRKGKKWANKRKAKLPSFPPILRASRPIFRTQNHMDCRSLCPLPEGQVSKLQTSPNLQLFGDSNSKSLKRNPLINPYSGRPALCCVYNCHELLYFLCLLLKDNLLNSCNVNLQEAYFCRVITSLNMLGMDLEQSSKHRVSPLGYMSNNAV